jgi:hypothetical protein
MRVVYATTIPDLHVMLMLMMMMISSGRYRGRSSHYWKDIVRHAEIAVVAVVVVVVGVAAVNTAGRDSYRRVGRNGSGVLRSERASRHKVAIAAQIRNQKKKTKI